MARVASAQHGVVALWQLRWLGLTAANVRRWVRTGRLHRVHAGVYAVGHSAIFERSRVLAAVLACGPAAAATGRAAIAVRGLGYQGAIPVDVLVPFGSRRRRRGIRPIRCRSLTAADLTQWKGVPVASLPRTLLDLSATVGEAELRETAARAQRRNLLHQEELDALLARSEGRRGVANLRELAAEMTPVGGIPRLGLEQAFLRLCRRYRIPPPEVNRLVRLEHRSIQVDFSWPEHRLVVETDGRGSHADWVAAEEDRARDQELTLIGWTALRFTHRQVTRSPARTASVIRRMLGLPPLS